MSNIDDKLRAMLATINAATPGPYHVETVHLDDDIAYEVSARSDGFHVSFYQTNCMDHGVTAKSQARFYTQSRTDWERTVRALQRVLAEVKRSTDKDFYEHCCAKVEEILSGAGGDSGKV